MEAILLLFDIDGTLISGKGVPKRVILEVLRRRFPHYTRGEEVRFSGMTDPQIVTDLLTLNNHEEITNKDIENILDEFVVELARHVTPASPPHILPGVRALLDACDGYRHVYYGLVTGNIMKGAQIKLQAVDLYRRFAVGAFGNDHILRDKLPPLALKRAQNYFDVPFSPARTWIIGDSLKDVQCAVNNGLRCLAVETGRIEAATLKEAGATAVLKDLSDTGAVLKILEIEA